MYTDNHLVAEVDRSKHLEIIRRHLNAEEARSQHLLEMKRSFVRYVSHEIRTPLSIVTMGLKLLEENFASSLLEGESTDGSEHSSVLELVRDMRDSSVTAVNTLNDLLLYEKIESNMLTIELTKVKLFDVVADVIKMFKIQVCILYSDTSYLYIHAYIGLYASLCIPYTIYMCIICILY